MCHLASIRFFLFPVPCGPYFIVLACSIECTPSCGLRRRLDTFQGTYARLIVDINLTTFSKWYTQRLLDLLVQDSTQPLQDSLALQQLSWASLSSQRKHILRMTTFPFTIPLLVRVPYVVRVQRQWLESAWRKNGTTQVCILPPPLNFVVN